MNAALTASLVLNLVTIIILLLLWRRGSAPGDPALQSRLETLDQSFTRRFTEIAVQLEKTRGELTLGISKELSATLDTLRGAVEQQLTSGREEQSHSLLRVTGNLENKFDQLTQRQAENSRES